MANIPTVSWDETTPADGSVASEGDDRIRELKTQIREVIDVDHDFPSSGQASDVGQHKQVTLQEQADLGTGAVGATILGSQTVSGKGELVYTDEDDNDVQITSGGKLGGGTPLYLKPTSAITALEIDMDYDESCISVSQSSAAASDKYLANLVSNASGTIVRIKSATTALAASKYALHVHSDIAQTNSPLILFEHEHASSTQHLLHLINAGTGNSIRLKQDGVQAGMYIDQNGNESAIIIDGDTTDKGGIYMDIDTNSASDTYAIQIICDNAGSGAPGGIDFSTFSANEPIFKAGADGAAIQTSSVNSTGSFYIKDASGNIRRVPYY